MEYKKKKATITRFIDLGYGCNNNCMFCFHTYDTKDHPSRFKKIEFPGKDKSTALVKQELDEIKEKNKNKDRNICVNFIGGEPTIRKDIVKLVRYSSKLDFKVMITTNGRMFAYEDFVKELVDAGLTKVQFSFHGHNEKIHDYLTRSKGSFKQAIKGLEFAKKYGLFISNKTVVVSKNFKYLDKIIDLLNQYEIDLFYFTAPIPFANAWENRDELILRMSDLAPYIVRAIEKISGMWKMDEEGIYHPNVLVEGIPFCLLETHKDRLFHSAGHDDRIKSPSCIKCIYFKKCEGIHKDYINIFGMKEFEPVEKQKNGKNN